MCKGSGLKTTIGCIQRVSNYALLTCATDHIMRFNIPCGVVRGKLLEANISMGKKPCPSPQASANNPACQKRKGKTAASNLSSMFPDQEHSWSGR